MNIFYTERHQAHHPGVMVVDGIPYTSEEVPDRIEVIRRAMESACIGRLLPPADHGLAPLQAVHTPDFLAFLQQASASRAPEGERAAPPGPLLGETFACRPVRHRTRHLTALAGYYGFGTGSPIGPATWEAAYWSAQCALSAAQALLAGEPRAYALCRPPGHHAAADLFGGFCYLNNAAIAARYLQQAWNARVAVLDIDYHHGNGTQEIFYQDPSVVYASLHAHPDDEYPYFWGGADETGEGAGAGCNRNWPLPQQCRDEAYLETLQQALDWIGGFQPAGLVVSLGLDIALGDAVGGFCITPQGFTQIGRRIAGLSARQQLPLLFVQEGGYRLDTLGESAVAFFSGLAM